MKEIRREAQKKVGKNWETTFIDNNEASVYEDLARDLIHKKLHGASYIRRIEDRCNYDGTRDITVYYMDSCRSIYTVKA